MSLRRHPSRPFALLAVGALLAAPALSSCGFDYATDRVNIVSGGVYDRDGEVDVLGAVVVAGEDDRGLFVAGLVNNSIEDADAFTGIEPATSETGVSPLEETAAPIDIPASGQVNLYDTGGVPVEGTFAAGDFVDVALTFENGQVSNIQVPVVTPCHQYSPEKLPNLELPTAAVGGTEASERYSCEPIPQDPEAEEEE
ncbi:hypothetical protein FE634_17815 [Nocardioides dongxiaopingii]|uniref:hypothetical protein n=1 Tax=Nocardioides sp. S-1144 TaxID=2582905 RepID=UPI00110EA2A9|nr:hypothetical protein [Nocardioides sp. S-1144]QCW51803.1 hypothetical protein FE634_17815 [Nocardioides sp. S-1144]